jgi:O-methyltransferase
LLAIVEEILTMPPSTDGVIVECGTYLGGRTSKLSLAASLVGRRLLACDSFQGLPELVPTDHLADKDAFVAGDFASRLEDVRANVARYGDASVVDFVPGWYQDSLRQLSETRIVCLFLDVDLHESIKTCVSMLWRHIEPGCKVFVHDVDRAPVVQPFQDAAWWNQHVEGRMPRFVGALTGMGRRRPLLGYATKP